MCLIAATISLGCMETNKGILHFIPLSAVRKRGRCNILVNWNCACEKQTLARLQEAVTWKPCGLFLNLEN